MRVVLLIGLILLTFSCQRKKNKRQVNLKIETVKSSIKMDTLSQIEKIDKKSLKDTVVDVLKYFKESELPNIYRLGGIAYHTFYLDNELSKIVLVYEGDRETLTKSYYFNGERDVFYLKRMYVIYDPPKWEENSMEVSVVKSEYFILNNSVRESTGKGIINSSEIMNDIKKLIWLSKKFVADEKNR